jgi:hypothetical protein
MERNDCWVWKKSCSVAFFFRNFLRLLRPIFPRPSPLDAGLSTTLHFCPLQITRYQPLSQVTPESRSAQVEGPLVSPFQLSAFASHATYCAPRFPFFPFAFFLLFIDIGSILNHPERHEKHHGKH